MLRKFLFLVGVLFYLSGCKPSFEKKLEGIWVVREIIADSLYYQNYPEPIIQQAFEIKKRSYIVVHADYTIDFVSPGSVHHGKWRAGRNGTSIITLFEGEKFSDSISIEVITDSSLTIIDKSAKGCIRTVYLKDGFISF